MGEGGEEGEGEDLTSTLRGVERIRLLRSPRVTILADSPPWPDSCHEREEHPSSVSLFRSST